MKVAETARCVSPTNTTATASAHASARLRVVVEGKSVSGDGDLRGEHGDGRVRDREVGAEREPRAVPVTPDGVARERRLAQRERRIAVAAGRSGDRPDERSIERRVGDGSGYEHWHESLLDRLYRNELDGPRFPHRLNDAGRGQVVHVEADAAVVAAGPREKVAVRWRDREAHDAVADERVVRPEH